MGSCLLRLLRSNGTAIRASATPAVKSMACSMTTLVYTTSKAADTSSSMKTSKPKLAQQQPQQQPEVEAGQLWEPSHQRRHKLAALDRALRLAVGPSLQQLGLVQEGPCLQPELPSATSLLQQLPTEHRLPLLTTLLQAIGQGVMQSSIQGNASGSYSSPALEVVGGRAFPLYVELTQDLLQLLAAQAHLELGGGSALSNILGTTAVTSSMAAAMAWPPGLQLGPSWHQSGGLLNSKRPRRPFLVGANSRALQSELEHSVQADFFDLVGPESSSRLAPAAAAAAAASTGITHHKTHSTTTMPHGSNSAAASASGGSGSSRGRRSHGQGKNRARSRGKGKGRAAAARPSDDLGVAAGHQRGPSVASSSLTSQDQGCSSPKQQQLTWQQRQERLQGACERRLAALASLGSLNRLGHQDGSARLASTPAADAAAGAGEQLLQLLQQGLLVSTSHAQQQLEAAAQAATALDQQQMQPAQTAPATSDAAKAARRAAIVKLRVALKALSTVLQQSPSSMVSAAQAAISSAAAGPVEMLQAQLRALAAAAAEREGIARSSSGAPGRQPASGSSSSNTAMRDNSPITTPSSSGSSVTGGRIGCYSLQQVHQALTAVELPPHELGRAVQGLVAAAGRALPAAISSWLDMTVWPPAVLFKNAQDAGQELALQQVWVLERALMHLSKASGSSSSSSSTFNDRSSTSSASISMRAGSTSPSHDSTNHHPPPLEQTLRLLLAGLAMESKQQMLQEGLQAACNAAEQELCSTEDRIVGWLQYAQVQLSELGVPAAAGHPRPDAWWEQVLIQRENGSLDGVDPWLQLQPDVLEVLQEEEDVADYQQLLLDQPEQALQYCMLQALVDMMGTALEPAGMQADQLWQQLEGLSLQAQRSMLADALGHLQEQQQSEQGQSSSSAGVRDLLIPTLSSWVSSLQRRVGEQLQQQRPTAGAATQEMFVAVRDLLCEVELLLAASEVWQNVVSQGRCLQLQQAWQQLWEALYLLQQLQRGQPPRTTGAKVQCSNCGCSSSTRSSNSQCNGRGGTEPGGQTMLQYMAHLAAADAQAVPQGLEGQAAVAHLLALYHQQLTSLQGDWVGAGACQEDDEASSTANANLRISYRRVVLTRGRLEAALRGGGVSAAQRMRLLNLLGPAWWQLGSEAGPEAELGQLAAQAMPWPWPSKEGVAAGATAGAGAGSGGFVPQQGAPSTWLAQLWFTSADDELDTAEGSIQGTTIQVSAMLFHGVRVQSKAQIAAIMRQQVVRAGYSSNNTQHLTEAIRSEALSGLWEMQRAVAAATALQLLAEQGLLLPCWSQLGGPAAGLPLYTAPTKTRSSSSSSSSSAAEAAAAVAAMTLLEATGVGIKPEDMQVQGGDLLALIRALPSAAVEEMMKHLPVLLQLQLMPGLTHLALASGAMCCYMPPAPPAPDSSAAAPAPDPQDASSRRQPWLHGLDALSQLCRVHSTLVSACSSQEAQLQGGPAAAGMGPAVRAVFELMVALTPDGLLNLACQLPPPTHITLPTNRHAGSGSAGEDPDLLEHEVPPYTLLYWAQQLIGFGAHFVLLQQPGVRTRPQVVQRWPPTGTPLPDTWAAKLWKLLGQPSSASLPAGGADSGASSSNNSAWAAARSAAAGDPGSPPPFTLTQLGRALRMNMQKTSSPPQLAHAWLLAQLLACDPMAPLPPGASITDQPPPGAAPQDTPQEAGWLAMQMFHPAAGDAVLQAALWQEGPLPAPAPQSSSSSTSTAGFTFTGRPRGSSNSRATAADTPHAASGASICPSTSSSIGSDVLASMLPRQVVLPCAEDLEAPQLLVGFAGLWHATMRALQLNHASQADRLSAFRRVVSWLGQGWLAALGDQLGTAGGRSSAPAGSAAASGGQGGAVAGSSGWQEGPPVCDMCGAAEPQGGGKEGEQGDAGWVWCPGCEVALFCSSSCRQEARRQGHHTAQGCSQLLLWHKTKLWADEPFE